MKKEFKYIYEKDVELKIPKKENVKLIKSIDFLDFSLIDFSLNGVTDFKQADNFTEIINLLELNKNDVNRLYKDFINNSKQETKENYTFFNDNREFTINFYRIGYKDYFRFVCYWEWKPNQRQSFLELEALIKIYN